MSAPTPLVKHGGKGYASLVLKAVRDAVKTHAAGKYSLVYLGAYNWATHSFDVHRFAACVFMMDAARSVPGKPPGSTTLTLSLDLFTQGPGHAEDAGFDPDAFADMLEDAFDIASSLLKLRDSRGDSVILSLNVLNIVGAGFPDSHNRPQGLVLTLEVTF